MLGRSASLAEAEETSIETTKRKRRFLMNSFLSVSRGAVQFLEMIDLALALGTNMDGQDRQDGIRGSIESAIIGEFCATLLVEERFLTRTK
jgi:hypothetical protein